MYRVRKIVLFIMISIDEKILFRLFITVITLLIVRDNYRQGKLISIARNIYR